MLREGNSTACPTCGHEFEPGEKAIHTHTRYGSRLFCPEHFYAVPRPELSDPNKP